MTADGQRQPERLLGQSPALATIEKSEREESGMLQAEKGVLRESSGNVRRVPAPTRRDDTTLVGDGWTFTVKPGFVIREGPRRGDYEVVRQP